MFIVKYKSMANQKIGYICACHTSEEAIGRIISCYRADEIKGVLGQTYYYMEGI